MEKAVAAILIFFMMGISIGQMSTELNKQYFTCFVKNSWR